MTLSDLTPSRFRNYPHRQQRQRKHERGSPAPPNLPPAPQPATPLAPVPVPTLLIPTPTPSSRIATSIVSSSRPTAGPPCAREQRGRGFGRARGAQNRWEQDDLRCLRRAPQAEGGGGFWSCGRSGAGSRGRAGRQRSGDEGGDGTATAQLERGSPARESALRLKRWSLENCSVRYKALTGDSERALAILRSVSVRHRAFAGCGRRGTAQEKKGSASVCGGVSAAKFTEPHEI